MGGNHQATTVKRHLQIFFVILVAFLAFCAGASAGRGSMNEEILDEIRADLVQIIVLAKVGEPKPCSAPRSKPKENMPT